MGIGYLPLTTRDHAPDRVARASARRRPAPSGPAPRRARRARDPGAARRERPRDRRRVPRGRAALPGARGSRARPRASAGRSARRREVILAGGAFNTPQLLMLSGHRAARGAGAPRHRGPRGPARRGPEPPGPLRGRRGEPDGLRPLEGPGGGPLRPGRSAVPGVGGPAARSLREQRRDPRRERALRAGAPPARPLLLRRSWRSSRATTPATRRRSPSASTTSRGRSSRRTPATGRARCPSARPTRGSRRTSTSATSRKAATRRARTSTRSSPASSSSGASTPGSSARGSSPRRRFPGEHVRTDAELRDFVRAHAWGHHAVLHVPDRAARAGRRADRGLPRARHAGPARGRRLGVPADPGLLSRERGLHGRREGGRRHPRRGGRADHSAPGARSREEAIDMAYDVPQLLKMSQKELDDLFTKSSPGDIPDGEAQGTAIVAPGTTYSAEHRDARQPLRLAGQDLRRQEGRPEEPDPAVRVQRHHRQDLQGAELARRQGVHRPRLLGHLAGRAVDPRRDPADRPRPLPRQGLLEPEAPHGLRPEVLSGP